MSWGADTDQESHDRCVFASPTSRAVEALLQKTGNTQLLHNTWSVETSEEDEFAITSLISGKGKERKKTRFYVFKESDKWIEGNFYIVRINFIT